MIQRKQMVESYKRTYYTLVTRLFKKIFSVKQPGIVQTFSYFLYENLITLNPEG